MNWSSPELESIKVSITTPLLTKKRLAAFRVAPLQKVKKSLNFPWPLNSFHWPFINEKQSMFTFALAFFAGYWYLSLHFQPLSTQCQIDLSACFAAYVSSFRKKCISESWRKLMNYKRVNRIPWLWQYQRFSLTVATLELVKFPCLQLRQCAAFSRLRQRSCKRNHELQCFSYINAQASDYNSDSVYIASASLEWLGKYLIYWFFTAWTIC